METKYVSVHACKTKNLLDIMKHQDCNNSYRNFKSHLPEYYTALGYTAVTIIKNLKNKTDIKQTGAYSH